MRNVFSSKFYLGNYLHKNNLGINFIAKKMQSQNIIEHNLFFNKIISTRIGDITYLNSENSKKVDDLLMSENYKYSIDQLMEIAGLSVAECVNDFLQEKKEILKNGKILVICGPGSKIIN